MVRFFLVMQMARQPSGRVNIRSLSSLPSLPSLSSLPSSQNHQRRSFNTHHRTEVLKILDINKFDDDEITKSYNNLHSSSSSDKKTTGADKYNDVSIKIIENNIRNELIRSGNDENNMKYSDKEVDNMIKQLEGSILMKSEDGKITVDEYRNRIRTFGEKLDNRLVALAGSLLLSGSSIGIIVPCMPILIQTLNITPGEFGCVISAFGISKLLGNIPSSYYVNIHGRKPIMIGGII